jgi:signal transduction histidine kinase/ActR/RegA family two-component response regulator
MLNFEMAWLLNKATKEKGEERQKTLNYLRKEMALFEEVLFALKDGSKKYDLEQLPHKLLVIQLNDLIEKWNSKVKPTLIKAIEGSPDAFREYNSIIHDYVNEIDLFVKLLDENYADEIILYGRLRLAVMGLAVFTFFGIILYVRHHLIRPIKILRTGAIEIGNGNFNVKVDVKNNDEIGVLANEFNKMASDLKKLYEDLKNEEAEKRNLQAQLFQSQKIEAIGTLTAGIAHDFNNMLTGIIGFSELAQVQASGQVKERIDKVLEISDRAANLVRQILLVGRKILPEQRPVDINKLIEDSISMFRRILEENIEIKVFPQTNLPIVEADPSQITQVLMNLVVNARDSMPDGGTITIKTEGLYIDEDYCRNYSWAKSGNYVTISVMDAGEGIPDKIRDRIFEPFFTTKEVGKGTGLGLAVTYSIIKNHGGWINFYSEVGKGTEFRVYLPVADINTVLVEEDLLMDKPLPRGTETIFLIDDEQIILNLGESILHGLGYKVITASDGEEAVKIYRERGNEIALVILDKVMPVMSGIEAYKNLREINPAVKVILSSGHVIDNMQELRKSGFANFLNKPYRMADVAKVVRKTIDTH